MFFQNFFFVSAGTSLLLTISLAQKTTTTVSSVNTTVSVNTTCGSTIGNCLGWYFDQVIEYLDSLGFLDASYALGVLVFKTVLTIMSYPSAQFVLFWVAVCYLLCTLFKPFVIAVKIFFFPVRKLAIVTKRVVRPCLPYLTRDEVNYYRTYLAQGKGDLMSFDDDNLSPPEPNDDIKVDLTPAPPSESVSAPVITKPNKQTDMLRVKCENDMLVSNRSPNCPQPNILENDTKCGTLEYGILHECAPPRVEFEDPINTTSIDVESMYSRMARVGDFAWAAGAAPGATIFTDTVKNLLNSSTQYRQLIARYTNVRFDVRLVLTCQHNTSALGSAVVMFVPQSANQTPIGTAANSIALVNNFGLFPNVWLTAAEDRTAVLEIPFISSYIWRDRGLTTVTPVDASEHGRIYVMVGHQLAVPAGVPTNFNMELHLQMVNIKATYALAPLFATQGLLDVTVNNFDNVRDSTLSTSKGGDKFDTVLGLDHPADTRNPVSMVRRTFQNFFSTRGPLTLERMTFNQCDESLKRVKGKDEMSLEYLMACPNIYRRFNITSGTVKGSKIFDLPLHPNEAGNTHYVVNAMSAGFTYESVTVGVRIPKTLYQTGKLFLCLSQGIVDANGNVKTSIPATLTASREMLSFPGMIIDLNSKDFEHTFTIPWHGNAPWIPSVSCMGQNPNGNSYFYSTVTTSGMIMSIPVVSAYVLIPPSTSSNVANSINGVVTMCYSGYRGVYGMAPMCRAVFSEGKNTTVEVAHPFPSPRIDDIISLRQIWQQLHMFESGKLSLDRSIFRFSFADVIKSFELSGMYLYAQGSIRFTLMFANWNCDWLSIEYLSPNYPKATPTPAEAVIAQTTSEFLAFPNFLGDGSYTPFLSQTYAADWFGSGTMCKPIFVDKNHPYAVVEIPITRPTGVLNTNMDKFGGVFSFSPCGTSNAEFVRCAIFVSAGDDFRMSHIKAGVTSTLYDRVNTNTLPPWDF